MTTHAEPPTRTVAPARWRPPVAIAVVVGALVVSQAVALAVILVVGDTDTATAAAFVLADLLLVAIVIGSAARGAERLTAATLGVRRTRFWQAVGWALGSIGAVLSIANMVAGAIMATS
jgi:hypothetical protein